MIDVGAMDLHNLEPHEYRDRVKIYTQRLQQQWSSVQYPSNLPTGITIIVDFCNKLMH